jgi:hypothetical protein
MWMTTDSVSPNVTGQFFILLGKAHKHGKHFRVQVLLVYVGANPLPGPVLLAVDLDFNAPSAGKVVFTPRLLSGTI